MGHKYFVSSKKRKLTCHKQHVHDSMKEAGRCDELTLLEKGGAVSGLRYQPKFLLQPSFRYKNRTIRKIEYIADFMYKDKKWGKTVIEDVKGFYTPVYLLKKKLFIYIIRKTEWIFLETK